MKQIFLVIIAVVVLASCKKERFDEVQVAPVVTNTPTVAVVIDGQSTMMQLGAAHLVNIGLVSTIPDAYELNGSPLYSVMGYLDNYPMSFGPEDYVTVILYGDNPTTLCNISMAQGQGGPPNRVTFKAQVINTPLGYQNAFVIMGY
jgi:hypothetical protein